MEDVMKIASTVCKINGKVDLKCHVYSTLNNTENDAFVNYVAFRQVKDTLYINLYGFCTINKLGEFGGEHSFTIDTSNLGSVATTFNIFLNNIINGKYFINDKENNILLAEPNNKDNEYTLTNYKSSKSLKILPVVIYDNGELSYEGVRFVFNRDDNFIDVFAEDFLTLARAIDKIDIFMYSHTLAQVYFETIDKEFSKQKIIKNPLDLKGD